MACLRCAMYSAKYMPPCPNHCAESDSQFDAEGDAAKREKNVSVLKRGGLGVMRIQVIRIQDENHACVSDVSGRTFTLLCRGMADIVRSCSASCRGRSGVQKSVCLIRRVSLSCFDHKMNHTRRDSPESINLMNAIVRGLALPRIDMANRASLSMDPIRSFWHVFRDVRR